VSETKEKRKRPESTRQADKRYRRTFRGRYLAAQNAAKRRSLPFVLSPEEYAYLISLPCFYCQAPTGSTGSGLDRILNTGGYEVENVLPCCGPCNRVRSDEFSVEENYVMQRARLTYKNNSNSS
jgi:hypothetical protein